MATLDTTPGEWEFVEGEPGFMGSLEEPPEPTYPPTIFVSNDDGDFELAQLIEPLYSIEPEDEYDEGLRYCGNTGANGRLMAAAPALLNALLRLDSVSEKMDGVANDYWQFTLRDVRAAIHKATGEE